MFIYFLIDKNFIFFVVLSNVCALSNIIRALLFKKLITKMLLLQLGSSFCFPLKVDVVILSKI